MAMSKDVRDAIAAHTSKFGKGKDADLKNLSMQLTRGAAPSKLQEAYNDWCTKQHKDRAQFDSAVAFMVIAAGHLRSHFGIGDIRTKAVIQAELDMLEELIEKKEDQGVATPRDMLKKREDLQKELKEARDALKRIK